MTTRAIVKTRRGIGEGRDNPNNMLEFITRELDDRFFDIVGEGNWTAQFGPVPDPRGPAYDRSRIAARDSLAQEIIAHPDGVPLILLGFSGGAHVVGDALRMLPWEARKKVTRAVMVADPAMPAAIAPHQLVGARRDGAWGITGGRGIWTPTTSKMLCWVAHPADVICCCPALSPLRSLADVLTSMSLDDLDGWYVELHRRVLARALQPTDPRLPQLRQAVVDLQGYTRRAEHVKHYPPLLTGIGERLNREFAR